LNRSASEEAPTAFPELDQREKNPWLRQAVELELAREGLGRATEALRRFTHFAPQSN